MKLFLAAFVVVLATCVFLPQGSTGQDPPSSTPLPELPAAGNQRFFFSNSGDPCANMLYQMLNITDAKCSLQCYIQAGLQQGGYCDNQACQCNQIA